MYSRYCALLIFLAMFWTMPVSALKLSEYSNSGSIIQLLKKQGYRLPVSYYPPDGKSLALALSYLLFHQDSGVDDLQGEINRLCEEVMSQPLPDECLDYGDTFNDWHNADALVYALAAQRVLQNLSIRRTLIVYTLSRQGELFVHVYPTQPLLITDQEEMLEWALKHNPVTLFFNAHTHIFTPAVGLNEEIPGLLFTHPTDLGIIGNTLMMGGFVIFLVIVYLVLIDS